MLTRTLKMTFWVTYDHIGKLVAVSLLTALVVSLPGSIAFAALQSGDAAVGFIVGLPCLFLALGVGAPIGGAGAAHLVKVLIETRDGSFSDFLRGIRLYALKAAGVGAVYFVAAFALATSVWFYSAKLEGPWVWLGYALSGLALWALVFLGLTALLVIPALIHKKAGVFAAVKLSALLVMDNLLFVIGLFVQWVIWLFLCVLVWPLLFFLFTGVSMALTASAYEIIARKYARRELEVLGVKLAPGQRVVVHNVELVAEECDDYLNRGFRDFLFPWKG